MGLFDRFRGRQADTPDDPTDEPASDEPEPAGPEQLHELFGLPSGTTVRDDDRNLTLEHVPLGELAFPSGKVAFCDPLAGDGSLFVTVAPGTTGRATALGVRLAPDHLRVAALALELAEGPVSAWTMFVPEGESVDEGSIYGFGVDAGVACFADPAALAALHEQQARYYDQPGSLSGHEPVVDDLYQDDRPVHALLYDAGPGLAISRSGWGDGVYATYVGAGSGGEVARLMISFDVLSADLAPSSS